MKTCILLMKISAFCHRPQEGNATKFKKFYLIILVICTFDNVSGEKGYQGNMKRSLSPIIYQFGSTINDFITIKTYFNKIINDCFLSTILSFEHEPNKKNKNKFAMISKLSDEVE